MKSIILMTTYDCNADCFYCPIKKKKEQMNSLISLKTLDLFLETGDFAKKIKFFGGEPLLNYKVIEKSIQYVGQRAKFELTTNGCLLDRKKIDFLLKNNTDLTISFDFLKKKSFSAPQLIKEMSLLDEITVALMAIPENITSLSENFHTFFKFGIQRFNILPIVYTVVWKKSKLKQLEQELEKIAFTFRKMKSKNKPIFLKGFENSEDELLKGVPLISHYLFIDTNGDIYANDLVLIGLPNKYKKELKLGNVKQIKSFLDIEISSQPINSLESILTKEVIESNQQVKKVLDKINKLI